MKILINVCVFDVNDHSPADYAEIEVTADLKALIYRFKAMLAFSPEADMVSKFDFSPTLHLHNCDERMDYCKLVVRKDHLNWEGTLKYADHRVATGGITFDVLDSEVDVDLRAKPDADE